MNKVNRIDLSQIRKKVEILNEARRKLTFRLLCGQPLIQGIAYKIFKKCGKKNCKCRKGQLHGPYPVLSLYKDGKQKLIVIKKGEIAQIVQKAHRYRNHRRMLAMIGRANKEINNLLEEARIKTTEEYS